MTAIAAPPRAPTRPAASPEGMGVPTAPPAAAAAVPPRRRRFEPVTMAQREAVWEAWRSGRSQRQVGREVGLHHSTVGSLWRAFEADECRPRPATVGEMRELAEDYPGDRLRIRTVIELRGRYWRSAPLIPPALALFNPHALASGIGAELLRDLTADLADRCHGQLV